MIEEIQAELHENNHYIRTLKTAKEIILAERNDELRIVINEDSQPVGEHRRRYNNQISSEVVVTMPEDTRSSNRDIIIRYKEGELERINEYNQSYVPLQYILPTWISI